MDARSSSGSPDVPAGKPRKRPLLPPDFVRAMLAGHSALGIAFAALIYVVCITGTVSVFVNELRRWEQPDAPVLTEAPTAQAVATALAEGHARAVADGAAHDMFLIGPGTSNARLSVLYRGETPEAEGAWLADATGRLSAPLHAPWSEFISHLHATLHLPGTWGLFLVGLVGVTLLSSLISGLLSHPRIFRDAFAMRWGGSRQLQEADLHNRLGVWGLPFHFVVSLSGALLGLSTLIVGVLALAAYEGNSEKAFAAILGPLAREDDRPAPLPDVAAMIRQVETAHPDATFASVNVQHVATAGQVVHLGMRTPRHLPLANVYYFDGDGRAMGDGGLEAGGIGQQILGALQPLHFGWFGGMPVKIAYGVLGLALSVIAHNGITIWLARRRAKGRAAPGFEKVWSAVAWSQPLAFGITAGASFFLSEKALVSVYLVATALALAYARRARDEAAVARPLRLASAAIITGVVALHLVLMRGRLDDAMALYVNAAFLVVALVLAWPVVRRPRLSA